MRNLEEYDKLPPGEDGMENRNSRRQREQETIQKMIFLYCRENHKPVDQGLCEECGALLDYSLERLHRCPFGENKSTCAKCTIHCYRPAMREKVRQVMRYAGPRMLFHHPYLAVMHLLDGLRKPPVLKKT